MKAASCEARNATAYPISSTEPSRRSGIATAISKYSSALIQPFPKSARCRDFRAILRYERILSDWMVEQKGFDMVFDTADLEDAKVLLYQLDSGAWCARSATTTIRLMHFCMEYGTGRRTLGEH